MIGTSSNKAQESVVVEPLVTTRKAEIVVIAKANIIEKRRSIHITPYPVATLNPHEPPAFGRDQ